MTITNLKKKQLLTSLLIGLFAVSFCTSCVDRFEDIEKYQRPARLDGKIYTLISKQKNMTIFSQFMVDIGYDKLLDLTGTYAAFVPSDSVMKIYLMENYGTVDPASIDSTVKSAIVRYHILPMPWSKDQLQRLSSRGWINLNDISNNKPTAFKRKTLYREPNKTYKIQRFLSGTIPYDIIVPDSDPSSVTRTVYSASPKYVPLFFDGFMNAKGLSSSDYSMYFGRPYESGQVYYAGAKIIGNEIFAENGFVYLVDKVVKPLNTIEQILEKGSYTQFLQLMHNRSLFTFNQSATLAQPGASDGAVVEDLYNLSYVQSFPLNIHDELVNSSTYTVELHNGLLAPTDEAMDKFFNDYLRSWGTSWNSVPRNIQRLFLNSHIASEAVYQKNINAGFYNVSGDIVSKSDIDIEKAIYGSNGTFIGLNKSIVPKYFSSVSAPLFLNPLYETFSGAYDATRLISSLKNPTTKFSLFIIDNVSLSRDSSLNVLNIGNFSFITAFDHSVDQVVNMLSGDYRNILIRKLYGQIGIQPILGVAKREYIETLDGRHIIVQNDTISGGVPSEFGFNSGIDTTVVFSKINDYPITNGSTYKCNGWLKFTNTGTYEHLRGTKFLTLLSKVGLASVLNERVTFMNPTERYTIFVPSDAALNSVNADNMPLADLKNLLSFHIVKGSFVFTDGRQPMGAYRTLNDKYIRLRPMTDKIQILRSDNSVMYDGLVMSNTTNLLGMYLQIAAEAYSITNAVVHKMNTVFIPY